jgi:hypothetical protein
VYEPSLAVMVASTGALPCIDKTSKPSPAPTVVVAAQSVGAVELLANRYSYLNVPDEDWVWMFGAQKSESGLSTHLCAQELVTHAPLEHVSIVAAPVQRVSPFRHAPTRTQRACPETS